MKGLGSCKSLLSADKDSDGLVQGRLSCEALRSEVSSSGDTPGAEAEDRAARPRGVLHILRRHLGLLRRRSLRSRRALLRRRCRRHRRA